MANDNAKLAEFADNLWNNFIKPKMKDYQKDVLRYYRAEVTDNPGNSKLTVQKPYDNEVTIPCADYMSNAVVGDQVLVLRFGNGATNSNHLVFAYGNGNTSRS